MNIHQFYPSAGGSPHMSLVTFLTSFFLVKGEFLLLLVVVWWFMFWVSVDQQTMLIVTGRNKSLKLNLNICVFLRNSSAGSQQGTFSQQNQWKSLWSHGGLHRQAL